MKLQNLIELSLPIGYKSFHKDTYAHSYYDLNKIVVKTDMGNLFTEYKTEEACGIQFEGHELRPRSQTEPDAPLWVIREWAGDERIEIRRNYIKWMDNFASIMATIKGM